MEEVGNINEIKARVGKDRGWGQGLESKPSFPRVGTEIKFP